MPMMLPATSARNLTPTSSALLSASLGDVGIVAPQIVHGHIWAPMVTCVPADGVSRLPLSSTARLRIVVSPCGPGVHTYVQLNIPIPVMTTLARCQVEPESTETSTPVTTPAASVAEPVMVTGVPL